MFKNLKFVEHISVWALNEEDGLVTCCFTVHLWEVKHRRLHKS